MLSGALRRIRVQATWRKVRWCYDSGFQARRVLRDDSSAVAVSGTTSVSAPIVCCYSFATSSSTSFPPLPPPSPSPPWPPLLPPSFPPLPPLLPPSLATTTSTTTAAAAAAATAATTTATATTSQSAGFLAFVRTGDHVAAEPTEYSVETRNN